jgi:hypothetical protein
MKLLKIQAGRSFGEAQPFARAVLIPIREFSFGVHYYHPKGGIPPCPLPMKLPTRDIV